MGVCIKRGDSTPGLGQTRHVGGASWRARLSQTDRGGCREGQHTRAGGVRTQTWGGRGLGVGRLAGKWCHGENIQEGGFTLGTSQRVCISWRTTKGP